MAQRSSTTAPSSGTKVDGLERQQESRKSGNGSDPLVPILALPKPNRFIPSEFGIKEASPASAAAAGVVSGPSGRESSGGGKEAPSASAEKPEADDGVHLQRLNKHSPRRVVTEGAPGGGAAPGGGEVQMWHLQDRTFGQPRAEIYLKVDKNPGGSVWFGGGRRVFGRGA